MFKIIAFSVVEPVSGPKSAHPKKPSREPQSHSMFLNVDSPTIYSSNIITEEGREGKILLPGIKVLKLKTIKPCPHLLISVPESHQFTSR